MEAGNGGKGRGAQASGTSYLKKTGQPPLLPTGTIGYYLYLTVDVSHRPRQVKIHYIMTQNHTISLLH